MLRQLCKFRRATPETRRFWLEAWVCVWRVRLVLWCMPSRYWQSWLPQRALPGTDTERRDAAQTRAVMEIVRLVSAWVPAATCLTQALAGLILLRRRGLTAQLRFGVVKATSANLQAHAWLEAESGIILGKVPQHTRYTPLINTGDGKL